MGGTREHCIFSRYPAGPFATQKRGHTLFNRGIADDLGITKFNQDRALGMLDEIAGKRYFSQFSRFTSTTSHYYSLCFSVFD
jgi:hypothetical protein